MKYFRRRDGAAITGRGQQQPRQRNSLINHSSVTMVKACSGVGFLPSFASSYFYSPRHYIHHQLLVEMVAANDEKGIITPPSDSLNNQRWEQQPPFDFSSKFGWDNFYKLGLGQQQVVSEDDCKTKIGDDDNDIIESLEYEWHPHMPHDAIVQAITPSVVAASQYHSQALHSSSSQQHQILPSILLVGCGNSALPRILHDAFDNIPVSVTCLDYSTICVDMIRSMYENACPNMNFVVGDATNLQNVIWEDDSDDHDVTITARQPKQFDIIIDKGLLDALMCGEGFDIGNLMDGVNEVLTPYEWGMHVLICFELSKASKQYLDDMSGLDWHFDITVKGSENGRGCLNLAKRCKSPITTEWIQC